MEISRKQLDIILIQSVPERCRPCYRADVVISRIGNSAFLGEISLDQAEEQTKAEFDDCENGYIESEGCFGGGSCGFGPTTNIG